MICWSILKSHSMGHQLIEFLEGVLVQQEIDSLTGAELAFLVLPGAALRSPALLGGCMA
jgi:hypothetical protein